MTTATKAIRDRLQHKSDYEVALIESNACAALESVGPDEATHPAAIQQVAIRDACREELEERHQDKIDKANFKNDADQCVDDIYDYR